MIEPLLQAERLLLHGMVEQAEQIYRRVAEQDPRNSIAVVGLARVALERGDDAAALTHARAALEIDPENVAAVRLEARLSEIFAERASRAFGSALQGGQPDAGGDAAWSSTGPGSPDAAPEARPSESVVFTRNPSMADHRRLEAATEEPTRSDAERAAPPAALPRRPGLLRRLLGRKGGD